MPNGWALARARGSRGRSDVGWVRLAAASVALCCVVLGACQNDDDLLKPGDVQTNVVTAIYMSPEDFAASPIEINGEALQREWGGPLDPTRPFAQIRLMGEEGAGSPGDPIYLSMKAVYTDTDLFLLLQWVDPRPDVSRDALIYIGPDLSGRVGCQDVLLQSENWTQEIDVRDLDEDRLYLAWEMTESGDDQGSFRQQGCQIACHQNQSPVFGRPGYGRLDVWMWLATRTNPARNLYIPTDNPNFPTFGIPAYLEDFSSDPISALAPDPGTPTWFRNWAGQGGPPLYIYRPIDDPYAAPPNPSECRNAFGERCRPNNGLPLYYIWREDPEGIYTNFGACDTINYAVLPQGQEPRKWEPGDAVGGYTYTYPSGSRADVRGKAIYSEGVWTLEIGRPLDTRDPASDIIFSGEPGDEVYFAAAVADNSQFHHWGSRAQTLRFGPKSAARGVAAGGEVER